MLFFCAPLGFSVGSRKKISNACHAGGVSLGKRSRWPSHFILLSLMISLHYLPSHFITLYRSIFDIFLGYTTFTAFLSILLWNESSPPSIVLLVVQIFVLHSLMWFLRSLSLNKSSKFLNAMLASFILFFMSASVSNNEPRYLHFFQLSSSPLLILYTSVLLSLIIRFLSLSFAGILSLTWLMLSSLFVATQWCHQHIVDLSSFPS